MRPKAFPFMIILALLPACSDAGSNKAAAPVPTLEDIQHGGMPTLAPPVPASVKKRDAAHEPEVRNAVEADNWTSPAIQQLSLQPLSAILTIARDRVPGEVIDADLGDDDGLMTYEVEILTAAGRKIEIKIDAHKGTILDVEED